MRKHAVFAAVLAAACSSGPVQYNGVVPSGLESAYKCAVARLNIMGYTIEEATEGIVVKGRKEYRYWFPLPGNGFDVLTVTSYDNPETGETNLRVTFAKEPSKDGKADARSLLEKCGVGNVVGRYD